MDRGERRCDFVILLEMKSYIGNVDRVRFLLESGAHKTMDKDDLGYTCLHAAASYGHMALLDFLLARDDCDLTARDDDGDSPLHVRHRLFVADSAPRSAKTKMWPRNSSTPAPTSLPSTTKDSHR